MMFIPILCRQPLFAGAAIPSILILLLGLIGFASRQPLFAGASIPRDTWQQNESGTWLRRQPLFAGASIPSQLLGRRLYRCSEVSPTPLRWGLYSEKVAGKTVNLAWDGSPTPLRWGLYSELKKLKRQIRVRPFLVANPSSLGPLFRAGKVLAISYAANNYSSPTPLRWGLYSESYVPGEYRWLPIGRQPLFAGASIPRAICPQ